MTPAGRLVGWMLEHEARFTPKPRRPVRPMTCPRCGSGDIHGDRPCRFRPELETDPKLRDHDWHCHACPWSAHVGDDDEG